MRKHLGVAAIVLIVCCLPRLAAARSASTPAFQHVNSIPETNVGKDTADQDSDTSAIPSLSIWKDFAVVWKIYQQCATENLSVCLKVKLLTGLERMTRSSKVLKLFEGLQFVRADGNAPTTTTYPDGLSTITEQAIEANLPRALAAKEQTLNNLIFKKVAGFLRDHTLQVKFPDVRNLEPSEGSDSVESRRKKKKGGSGAYIMIPLLLGGTFVPIAYGALAMLAGKALIVSKLALVLASIIGIKKLLSGASKDSHEVVVSSGSHSGWGRDMDVAYNGWKPAKESQPQHQ